MRRSFSKIALAAGFALALAFTFSCHDGGGGDGGSDIGGDQSSSSGISSSSSVKSSSSSSSIPSSSSIKSSSSSSVGVSSSSVKSSSSSNVSVESGSFTDSRDKQAYKWVKIGTQTWMAQNLNYKEKPVNPDPASKRSSKCYNNIDTNCNTYGRLYEWYDALLVCPDGWHLPTQAEWETLISFVGSSDAGKKLKSASNDWRDGAGIDTYGFGALPGGGFYNNEFGNLNIEGYWWTSKESSTSNAYQIQMRGKNQIVEENSPSKTNKLAVRCLNGYSSSSSIVYGNIIDTRDGKSYNTVKIGTQTWMAQNLNYTGANGVCYNNNSKNCEIYGRLYDWATAMGTSVNYNTEKLDASSGLRKGICPDGWHLSTVSEWEALISFVGSDAGTKLKARSGEWGDNYGTDTYGLGMLPGGGFYNNEFGNLNIEGYWWTSKESGTSNAYQTQMRSSNQIANNTPTKTNKLSVRCVED